MEASRLARSRGAVGPARSQSHAVPSAATQAISRLGNLYANALLRLSVAE